MPDISEFPSFSLTQWKEWFITTARLIINRTPPEGVAVFFQSDIRIEGVWVDKGFLCQQAAEREGSDLLWHRVASRVPIGHPTFGRAGYSHLLCFSKAVRPAGRSAAPDILPHVGEKTWERGMGVDACLHVARFIAEHTGTQTVVNPFCGYGSMLAAANAVGLGAIGIERSRKRAVRAEELLLDLEKRTWIVPE